MTYDTRMAEATPRLSPMDQVLQDLETVIDEVTKTNDRLAVAFQAVLRPMQTEPSPGDARVALEPDKEMPASDLVGRLRRMRAQLRRQVAIMHNMVEACDL